MAQGREQRLQGRSVQTQVGEDTAVHGDRGPPGHLPALWSNRGQCATSVFGVWSADDETLRLEAVDGIGDAGRIDLETLPDLAQWQGPLGGEREEHHHFVASEGEAEWAQFR